MLPLRQFVQGFCLSGFVLDFVLFFFLTFFFVLPHLTGFWVILVLRIFVRCSCFLRISLFSPFLRVSRFDRILRIPSFSPFYFSFWLVFVLSRLQVDNNTLSPWTLQPVTTSSSHPTPHHRTPPTQQHPATSQPHPTTLHSRSQTRRLTRTHHSKPRQTPARTFQDQDESTSFNLNCGGHARRGTRADL